ncbi:hypothetical protein CALVIDRAFT_560935 [Calocera viscosa TUFC12733]|uniref:Uncharacterized protein n=1 Tax=Calocera viscosa (strain TUFC12733) TaxID=1330018 RepID=A0A167QAS2_CALVF|nr:hypothetical protein CALVIDRAFT_560935 [Calocera viscosa TUFC12733]
MQLTSVVVLATLAAGIAANVRPGSIGTGQLRRIEKAEFRKGERMGERKEAKKIGGARFGGPRVGGARRQRSLDDDFELEARSQGRHKHGKHGHKKHGHKQAAAAAASESAPPSPTADSAPATPVSARAFDDFDFELEARSPPDTRSAMAALAKHSSHAAMAVAHMQMQHSMTEAHGTVAKHAAANIKDAAKKHRRSMEDDSELEVRSHRHHHKHGKHGHKKHGHKQAAAAASEPAPASPIADSAPATPVAARAFDDFDFELEARSPPDPHGAMAALAKHSSQAALAAAHINLQQSMAQAHANVAKHAAANIKDAAKKHRRSMDDFDFELEARSPPDPHGAIAAMAKHSNQVAMAAAHMQMQHSMTQAHANVAKHAAANIKDASKKHRRSMGDDDDYTEMDARSAPDVDVSTGGVASVSTFDGRRTTRVVRGGANMQANTGMRKVAIRGRGRRSLEELD